MTGQLGGAHPFCLETCLGGLKNRFHFLDEDFYFFFVFFLSGHFHLHANESNLREIECNGVALNLVAKFLGEGVIILFE